LSEVASPVDAGSGETTAVDRRVVGAEPVPEATPEAPVPARVMTLVHGVEAPDAVGKAEAVPLPNP